MPWRTAAPSNRLIVQGGFGNGSQTWVLTNANGIGGVPEWIQLPDLPVGRGWHSSAYNHANNRLLVFGGTPNGAVRYNDVWVLSDADGVGNPVWTQLTPIGAAPAPREEPAAAYDAGTNRLIVFGGFSRTGTAPPYTHYSDVWVLTNANGLGGVPEWIQLAPAGPVPPGRFGHAAAYNTSTNELFVFGGLAQPILEGVWTNVPFDDTWILTNANGLGGAPQWTQVATTGGPPLARFNHTAAYSPASDRLMVALGRHVIPGPLPQPSTFPRDAWILTPPGINAATGTPFRYDVEAHDPDIGDFLTYSLTTAPVGMAIDSASGSITWVPTRSQVGQHTVTVRVQDGSGLFDTQPFVVTVNLGNAPVVDAGPNQGLAIPTPAMLKASATDDGFPYPAQLTTEWSKNQRTRQRIVHRAYLPHHQRHVQRSGNLRIFD